MIESTIKNISLFNKIFAGTTLFHEVKMFLTPATFFLASKT